MRSIHKTANSHKKVRGFAYLLSSAVSLFLLLPTLLLPLAPVFADETDTSSEAQDIQPVAVVEEPSAAQPEQAVEEVPPLEVSETPAIETVPNDTTQESQSVVVDEAPSEAEQIIETSTSSDSLPDGDVSASTPETITSSVTPFNPSSTTETQDVVQVTEEQEVISQDAVVSLDTDVTIVPTTTTEILPEDVVLSTASTTIDVPGSSSVTNDDNRFTFSKDECTLVREGTFYCAKKSDEPEIVMDDGVYATADAGSDKEIYIRKNGVVTAITNNSEDDDAPYYDELSNTIIWHRLIDGRYQIISYDLQSSVEEQLTHDRYNNMEPKRFGNTTVWQGWVGNDWDVFMLNGNELTMITDNNFHDIAPSINGNHIVWQSFETSAWKMKVYDTRTKQVQTIEDSGGGSIENPRFVLVYDTKFESGDIETRGFDLQSGEVVPLSSTPKPVPEDIPDPDETGEKRALITSPTQPKTKVDDSGDDLPVDEPGLDTDSDQDTLVIPPFSEGTTTEATLNATSSDIIADELLILPDLETASSTETEHIEDLVIPAYEPLIEQSPDSQETIVPTP